MKPSEQIQKLKAEGDKLFNEIFALCIKHDVQLFSQMSTIPEIKEKTDKLNQIKDSIQQLQ